MTDSLDYDLLTASEERALLACAQLGDIDARNELIVKNQRLIKKIAAGCLHRGIGKNQELDDLVQWGVFGLIRAIAKWDSSRGLRLSTYSVPWIKAYIYRQGMSGDNTVSMSYTDTESMAKIRRARAALEQTLRRELTTEEIAAATGLKVKFVEYALRTVMSGNTQLDHSKTAGNESDHADCIDFYEILPDQDECTEDQAEQRAALCEIRQAMQSLLPEEQEIMYRRWLKVPADYYSEIGKDFGVTGSRIQQIEKRALSKIRLTLGLNSA